MGWANGMVAIKVGLTNCSSTALSERRIGSGIIDLLSLSGLTDLEVAESRQIFGAWVIIRWCADSGAIKDIEDLLLDVGRGDHRP